MDIVNVLLYLGLAVALFFLLRGVNLWYWKIDDRIKLQEETNQLLKSLIDRDKAPEPTKIPGNVTFEKQASLNEKEREQVAKQVRDPHGLSTKK